MYSPLVAFVIVVNIIYAFRSDACKVVIYNYDDKKGNYGGQITLYNSNT